MGSCLGKMPVTRDEFRNEIRLSTYELKTILYRIDGNVGLLCDSTICPTGKKRAKRSTVSINDGNAQMGHGLLIRSFASDCNYFILTAAHVAVKFVNDDAKGKKVTLKWHPWTDSVEQSVEPIVATATKVFIPEKYVKDGSIDVGLIEIQFNASTMESQGVEWCTLMIDKDPSADGVVVGEGNKIHLRGERVQSIPHDGSRHIVHAPSKPGMSGLPLFQANGHLVCLVHGDTKHRGGHTASEMDRPSPFLYADSISTKLKMICVKNDYAKKLLVAENLTPEIVEEAHLEPRSKKASEAYIEFAKYFGKELEMNESEIMSTSVNSMMEKLAEECFITGQFVEIIDSVLVAENTAVKEEQRKIDKLEQGHPSTMTKPATPSPVKRQRRQQAGEEATEV